MLQTKLGTQCCMQTAHCAQKTEQAKQSCRAARGQTLAVSELCCIYTCAIHAGLAVFASGRRVCAASGVTASSARLGNPTASGTPAAGPSAHETACTTTTSRSAVDGREASGIRRADRHQRSRLAIGATSGHDALRVLQGGQHSTPAGQPAAPDAHNGANAARLLCLFRVSACRSARDLRSDDITVVWCGVRADDRTASAPCVILKETLPCLSAACDVQQDDINLLLPCRLPQQLLHSAATQLGCPRPRALQRPYCQAA